MLMTKHKIVRQIVGFGETFNFLSLKLFFRNPSNFRMFPNRVFREYITLAEKDGWQCKDIFSIFDEIKESRINLEVMPGKGLSNPCHELVYLALIVKSLAPANIFEIGTFRGRTALNFALNCPDDCHIYTLDLLPGAKSTIFNGANSADVALIKKSSPGSDYRGKEGSHKIEQLYGDSTKFDFTPFHNRMDIVFIDGAHDYNAVRSDTQNALKIIRPGGVIIWDDFANYGEQHGVTRAACECIPKEEIIQIAGTQLAVYRSPSNARSEQAAHR